jgi:hypothetical protein
MSAKTNETNKTNNSKSATIGKGEHINESGLPVSPQMAWPISNVWIVVSISAVAFIAWSLICALVYYPALLRANHGIRFKWYMAAIAMVPLALFVHNVHVRIKDELMLPAVPADYGVCFVPQSDLTDKEKAFGAIGKVDYSCARNQYEMLQDRATTVQSQSYNLVYTLFTLVLLLFTVSRTKDIINRNDPFIKSLIISSMLLSVTTMISPMLANFYWSSLPMISLFEVIFQMNVATVILLISYLAFKIVKSIY